MANPSIIFKGVRSFLLTAKGLLLKDGHKIDNDGYRTYIRNQYPANTSDTDGWATYADAAGTDPVDGTGGSPNSTLTASSSNPLASDYHFRFTKNSGASRQGEGFSYDFTIQNADKARVIEIELNYSVSANFDYGTMGDTSDPSDIVWWIYDVTNSSLIQPSASQWMDGGGVHKLTFQSASDSTSYRLIGHIGVTTTLAWTFDWDIEYCGRQRKNIGYSASDIQVISAPTINGDTSDPTKGTTSEDELQWNLDGQFMHIKYEFSQTGAGAAGSGGYYLTIPGGYSGDANHISATTITNNRGSAVIYDGTTLHPAMLSLDPANPTRLYIYATDTNNTWGSGLGALSNATVRISLDAWIPIAGRSSNTLVSSDADTRTVAAKIYKSSAANHTSSGSHQDIAFETAEIDTHASFDNANDYWVCPVAGKYRISVSAGLGSAASGVMETAIKKNGSIIAYGPLILLNATYGTRSVGSTVVELNVGDYIGASAFQTSGGSLAYAASALETYIAIEKVSGPAQIAASEVVAVRYNSNAGQSIPNNSPTTLVHEDLVFNSHEGSYNISTGVFTAPIAGPYLIGCHLRFGNSISWATTEFAYLRANKNSGSEYAYLGYNTQFDSSNTYMSVGGFTMIWLNVGDTVEMEAAHNEGGSLALDGDANYNYVTFARLGGVM